MTPQSLKTKEEWIAIIQENNDQQLKLQISDCDLSGVNLENCYLEGAELIRVNLSGAIFEGLNLQHSKLTDVTFKDSLLNGALFTNSIIVNCSFENTETNGAWFSGSTIENSTFSLVKGEHTRFEHCILNNVDMSNAHFKYSYFRYAKFTGVNFLNTQVAGSDFDNANIEAKLLIDKDLSRCQLAFLNFEGADLRNTKLNDAYLFHAYMKKVNMNNHELDGVNLSYADLENANLNGLKIMDGEFEYTNLNGADLTNAHFLNSRSANGISFENACLDGFVLTEFDWESFHIEKRKELALPNESKAESEEDSITYSIAPPREIPTYSEDADYDDLEEVVSYLCPYSNTNIFDWLGNGFPKIKELVYFKDNLIGHYESIHVGVGYINYKHEFVEDEALQNAYYCMEDYILTKLNPALPYYRLILQHPEGDHADFVTVIYQGQLLNSEPDMIC